MRHVRHTLQACGVAAITLAGAAGAQAATKVDLILNWVAGGDHAPYYWARKQGLYDKAGIDLQLEQGKGSQLAVQKTGLGQSQMGLADLGVALLARGKGAETVAVINIYANSPQGLYWLKSTGIASAKDLAGKKIGNPPNDAARQMWPALAKAVGIDAGSVTWVNVQPNAKLAALKSKSIDATTSFYNIHHIFQRELGADMGFAAWKDIGLNPYGNSIIVNAEWLAKNKPLVAGFVKVTQQAFHDCVVTPKPCVEALVEANTGLTVENEMQNWALVTDLMSDETSRGVALGWMKPERVKDDYELVKTYFELEKPYDVTTAYTNEYLDKNVKMPK